MQEAQIQDFLDMLGCSRIKTSKDWVNSTCPFAPYTDKHKSREDAHPSFGVAISKGKSGYRCFTCAAKGNLSDLVQRLRHLMVQEGANEGVNFNEIYSWVAENDKEEEQTVATLKEKLSKVSYGTKAVVVGGIKVSKKVAQTSRNIEVSPDQPMDESELTQFYYPPEAVLNYLTKDRGLTPATIKAWDLRWHPDSKRIAFPIRDCQGQLVGISGRLLNPGKSKQKFLHSTGFNRDRYLYGEQRLREGGTGVGLLVEGFFDAIALCQLGYRAVAMMGTYPSVMQIEKLVRFFNEIVVVPDGDAPGYAAAEKAVEALKGRMPVRIAPVPKGYDPDELDPLYLREVVGDPE